MNFESMKATAEALIAVPNCCPELKAAGAAWLAAIGTDDEKAAARTFVEEAREDACDIDGTIEFFASPAAAAHFGAERASAMLRAAEAHKAAGGKYCNCEACSLAVDIFENADVIL